MEIDFGKKIVKLGKMVWSQFSTKVLQITTLDIDDWNNNKDQYSKENSSLEDKTEFIFT